jgi:hypothetical protein
MTGNNNGYWWDIAHVPSRHYEQEQSTNKERRLTFRRIVKIFVCVKCSLASILHQLLLVNLVYLL